MIRPIASKLIALALVALALPAAAEDAAAIRDLLCGRTVHYYNANLGNQIEYTAPDGAAYLWHSTTDQIIIGAWEVQADPREADKVCYTYPAGSFGYDDLGSQFCFTYGALMADVVDEGVREGDPYDLMSGTAAFPLPIWEPIDMDALRNQFADRDPVPGCGLLMM